MDWSYIAGFFDGEGGFHIVYGRSKRKGSLYLTPRMVVTFSSTNKEILDLIVDFMLSQEIKCKNYCHMRKKDYGGIKRKIAYSIRIAQPKDMRIFVSCIEPFLIEKKESCKIFKECLTFWEKAHVNRTNVHWTLEQLKEFNEFIKRLAPLHTKRKPTKLLL